MISENSKSFILKIIVKASLGFLCYFLIFSCVYQLQLILSESLLANYSYTTMTYISAIASIFLAVFIAKFIYRRQNIEQRINNIVGIAIKKGD